MWPAQANEAVGSDRVTGHWLAEGIASRDTRTAEFWSPG
jgi:hypothetical protein